MKDKLTAQLRRDEGEVLHAYEDHLGYLTLGVGRLIDKRRGGGITEEESAYLLNNDINTRVTALEARLPWFNGLDDARKGALVNMSFQLGVDGLLGFKNTLAEISKGNYDKASELMLLSKWASQTPERAKRIAKQVRTGEWQ